MLKRKWNQQEFHWILERWADVELIIESDIQVDQASRIYLKYLTFGHF